MADSNISELLIALDAYMQSKGNGPDYLAGKVAAVFSGKDAPFNVETGPLKGIKDKFQKLFNQLSTLVEPTKGVASLNRVLFGVNIKMKSFSSTMGKMDAHFQSLTKNVIATNKRLSSIFRNNTVSVAPTPASPTSKFGRSDNKVDLFNISGIALPRLSKAIIDAFGGTTGVVPLSKLLQVKIGAFTPLALKQFTATNEKPKGLLSEKEPRSLLAKPKHYYTIIQQTYKDAKEMGKGILSTIWSIIKVVGSVIIGIFALGKINKLLDSSPIGRSIKEKVGDFISTIFTKIGDYLTGDDFRNALSEGIKVIGSFFGGIKDFIVKYYKNHSDQINKSFSMIFDSLWNNMLAPLGNGIKDLAIVGFTSLLGSLKKNIEEQDWSALLTKVGIGAAILALVTGFSGAATVLFNPAVLAITAATVAGIAFIKRMETIADTLYDASDSVSRMESAFTIWTNKLNKKSAAAMAEANKIKNDPNSTKTEKLDASIKMAEIKRQEFANKQIAEQKRFIAQSSEWSEYILSLADPLDISKYRKNKQAEHDKINNNLLDIMARTNDEIDSLQHQKKYEADHMVKDILNNQLEKDKKIDRIAAEVTQNAVNKAPKIENKTVKDAIIVEPHSKDQILMGKSGGPFDDAFKDMNKKLETMIDVMLEGYGAMISATSNGSSMVANAVISSASNGNSQGNITSGGRNPVDEMRDKFKEIMKR